jgi:hypothetical protein
LKHQDGVFQEMWQTLKDDKAQKVIALYFEKQKERLRAKILKKKVLPLIK